MGFSASPCCYLLSYGWGLSPRLSFFLRVWSVRPGQPLRLVLQAPLFGTLQSESSDRVEPGLFDIRSFRVRVYEPTDGGCLVVLGSFQQPGAAVSRLPTLHHYSIVAMPAEGLAADLRATLFSSRPPIDICESRRKLGRQTCGGASALLQPRHESSPLHLSFLVHAPFPRPSVMGLCSVRADLPRGGPRLQDTLRLWYRLVVNCGDSLRTVTFSVRPSSQDMVEHGGARIALPVSPTVDPSASWWQCTLDSSACRMGGAMEDSQHGYGASLLRTSRTHETAAVPSDDVTFSQCGTLDVEALLRHCMRGRACNYDARLIALTDAPLTGPCPSPAPGGICSIGEACTPSATTLLVLVVVDLFLEQSSSAAPASALRTGMLPLQALGTAKPGARLYGRPAASDRNLARLSAAGSALRCTSAPKGGAESSDDWDAILQDSSSSASTSSSSTPRFASDAETVAGVACARLLSQRSVASGSSSSSDDETVACVSAPPVRASAPLPPQATPLVVNAVPPVRTLLFASIDTTSGAVRVLRLCKCAPAHQPAFDAARRRIGGGGLTGITTDLVTDIRRAFLPALTGARQGLQLARELNNDAVLTGVSLPALMHPAIPLALVA